MGIIKSYNGKFPQIGEDVFIAENAVIIGDVVIGQRSSIWYGAVVRGDINYIHIGSETNIQDNAVLHVTFGRFPLEIGNNVIVGHNATVHGCTVEDNVLIGIGASVLDGAKVGSNSLVAAGSLVGEGMEIPSGVLAAGVPARIKRELTQREQDLITDYSLRYVGYAEGYMADSVDGR